MKNLSNQSNKYNNSLKTTEKKVHTLEKVLTDESRDLQKLQASFKSSKERVLIAKKKANKNSSIKKRALPTIKKHENLSRQINTKKARVKRIKENLKEAKAEFKRISADKRQYEKAMKMYEKQWIKYYGRSNKSNINTRSKVDFSLQIRASRALLNLTELEFAELIGIESNLLKQIEQSNNNTILEPNLLKSIKSNLKNAGIELVENGFYIGAGGVGARMRTLPSNATAIKPKSKRVKRKKAKNNTKQNKKTRTFKAA